MQISIPIIYCLIFLCNKNSLILNVPSYFSEINHTVASFSYEILKDVLIYPHLNLDTVRILY